MRRSCTTASATRCLADGQIEPRACELRQEPGDRRGAGPGRRRRRRPAARSVGGPRPRRRGPGAKGDLDGALRSYRSGLAVAEAWRSWSRIAWTGAGTSPSASTASATCWRPSQARRGAVVLSPRARHRRGAGSARSPALDWQRDLAVACHKLGLLEAQLRPRGRGARGTRAGQGDRCPAQRTSPATRRNGTPTSRKSTPPCAPGSVSRPRGIPLPAQLAGGAAARQG